MGLVLKQIDGLLVLTVRGSFLCGLRWVGDLDKPGDGERRGGGGDAEYFGLRPIFLPLAAD